MAYEWVGPVVTGIVGVAGIAGTITAARISSRVQREAAQSAAQQSIRQARQILYARYLQAVDDMQDARRHGEEAVLAASGKMYSLVPEIAVVSGGFIATEAQELMTCLLALDAIPDDQEAFRMLDEANTRISRIAYLMHIDIADTSLRGMSERVAYLKNAAKRFEVGGAT
ncbi:hypothetical protein [Actinoplanes sp. NPDC048796]|uniref:hypothetical protein n=1 Tax=unclassified Actinoplanes TaxID=2626549 RepID=UPI0033F07608